MSAKLYKPGDKVRVRSDLIPMGLYDVAVISPMLDFRGKYAIVTDVTNCGDEPAYKLEDWDFYWTDEMFETPCVLNISSDEFLDFLER